jgi:hypothetical protein
MPKETFELMINTQFYILPLVLLVHVFHWFVCFRLQLKMRNINIDKKLIFFIFFASLYSLMGKQVISDSFYLIGVIFIYTLFLLTYKIKFIDILWLFVGIYLLMSIGVFIIATPLMLIPEVKDFLFNKPLGNCFGTIIEIIFPLILLIFSYKINFLDFFSKNRYYRLELIAILCIFIGIILLYHSSLLFLFLLSKISFYNILYHIIFEWIIVIFLIFTFFYFKKEINSNETMLDRIEKIIEENMKLKIELDAYNEK